VPWNGGSTWRMRKGVAALDTEVHGRVHAALEELTPRLVALSLDLHAHPELSMAECHAQEVLTDALERGGFAVERGVGSLPTAFVGRAGKPPGPRVAILMEYDALPGVGHACGHNLIAAAGLGGALAARMALGDEVRGEIWAMGTPGEEGEGGKITMLEEGAFQGVDAALMFHPGTHTWLVRHATASMHVTMRFYGKAAHAAASPELGRSALAALLHTFVMVDALRQHMPETARIHGIVVKGGEAPNIVPEYAEGAFLVRALTSGAAQALWERVRACAEGAALAAGVRVEFACGKMYAERKNNRVLAGIFGDYLAATGEEIEQPVLRGGTGSSDIGNVSLVLPAIHPYVAIAPDGVAGHSREFAEAARSGRGQEAMLHVAEALAHATVDLLVHPELVEEAWASFRATGPDLPQ